MKTPVSLRAYGLMMRGLGLVLPLYLKRRIAKGKEHPARYRERYGETKLSRPMGDLIWFHAASVGESVMLLVLIEHLKQKRPDLHVLVTTGTVTSAQTMAGQLPEGVLHQFLPADTPKAVQAFLSHWRPSLAIWAESELWPNLIRYAHHSGAKMVLVNARMSEKSLQGWAKRKGLARAVLDRFELIMPADIRTRDGLTPLTDTPLTDTIRLKDAAKPLDCNEERLTALQGQIGDRHVWVAASTHDGEDDIMMNAHKTVSDSLPNPLLIIAPRHPERTPDIAKRLNAVGSRFIKLSSGKPVTHDTGCLLIDGLGQMGLAYRLAQAAVVCGSFKPGLSGHNPLEPARLDCAVLSGPHHSSFDDVYSAMGNAVTILPNGDTLAPALISALQSPHEASTKAKNFAANRQSVLDDIWFFIRQYLPKPHLPGPEADDAEARNAPT